MAHEHVDLAVALRADLRTKLRRLRRQASDVHLSSRHHRDEAEHKLARSTATRA